MKVAIDEKSLTDAVGQGIISSQQAEELWSFLQREKHTGRAFAESLPLSDFFYYLGALIVIGAMSWFMNTAWEQFGGAGLFAIAGFYALAFVIAARRFKEKAQVLSGLFIVMAVCVTPLGVYGLQKWLSLWPQGYPGVYRDFHIWVKSGRFTMEIATVIAGLVGLRFARIPFAMAPVAFTLWYISMDVTPILFGTDNNWTYHKYVSMAFGLVMITLAFLADRRREIDYACWLYIFGAMAFWGGITSLHSTSELSKAFYCAVNVLMMLGGVLLERRVFLIFGALGAFGYIGHLAWTVFRDSLLFPFALTLVGLSIVYAGWVFHRRQAELVKLVQAAAPAWLIARLPKNRR